MAKKSKKMQDALEEVDSGRAYPAAEAVALAKETNIAKFNAAVEIAYRLNVDPKRADQRIRSTVVLPNGTGRTRTVLVFVKGGKAKEAEAAGADFVGNGDTIQKIQSGQFDFNVVVTIPDMMATVDRLGCVLGPKGLVPNPRTDTVTIGVTKAINRVKTGKVTYRIDRAGNIRVPTGKVSFDDEKLVKNFATIHNVLLKARPSAAKGQYMKNATITTVFEPGIHVGRVSF